MATSIDTRRLTLQLRDVRDAEWNHELLGEHEGGSTESVESVSGRPAEQRNQFADSGIGLLTIRRRDDEVPMGSGRGYPRKRSTVSDEKLPMQPGLPERRTHDYVSNRCPARRSRTRS